MQQKEALEAQIHVSCTGIQEGLSQKYNRQVRDAGKSAQRCRGLDANPGNPMRMRSLSPKTGESTHVCAKVAEHKIAVQQQQRAHV